MIEADRLLAERLQIREREVDDEEKGKLFMELIEKRRKHFVALRAQEKRNRPPTKAQKRSQMSTYLKHNKVGTNTKQLMDKERYKSNEKKVEGSEEKAKSSRKKSLVRKEAVKEHNKISKDTRTGGLIKETGQEPGPNRSKSNGIFISKDKYVAKILKKFDFASIKTASTPIEINKALIKDEEVEDVDFHLYRSMIGSLMHLTTSRPDIIFVVCACARFQVTPKMSYLNDVKRIFRYLKGQPKLGLWYPRDSPFDLEAFSDSDYAGASLDRKSTTGGCQFLDKRLISWQCKSKETRTPRYLSLVVPLKKVGDEAVHKELGDRMERAATTASSLEAKQDSGNGLMCQDTILRDVDAQTRFKTTSKQSNDPPLSKVNTFGSREDSLTYCCQFKLMMLMMLPVQVSTAEVNEASIRHDLKLDDVEGSPCLPNATIFEELTRMGAKTTAWNEFSSTMTSAIICLANNQKFNFSKYIFDSMVKNLENVNKFWMYPRFVQREGTGFSRKITSLFETMMVQASEEVGEDSDHPTDSNQIPIVLDLEKAKFDQAIEIASLKKRVEKLERRRKFRTTRLRRLKKGRSIEDIDADIEVTLVNENQERQDEDLMFDTGVLDDDEMFVDATIGEKDERVQRLMIVLLAAKPKAKGIVFHDLEKQENTQAMMVADRLLAKRFQTREREELTDKEKGKLFMELMEKRRKHFAALRA
ncbi:hypothetical protein Tco_1202693 [Tanacetum coccineum]